MRGANILYYNCNIQYTLYHHIAVGFMKSIFGNFSGCSCRKASRWKRSSNAAFLLGAFRERYCVVPHNGTTVVHGSTAGVADAHLWIPTQNMRDYSSQATEAAGPL